jgi:hypothetical protein
MSSHYEAPVRKPLVLGDKSYGDISTQTKNLLIAIGYCNDIGWLSALLNLLTG